MGSNCSSRQNHKDRDSISTRSEESPSYQISQKDQQGEQQQRDQSRADTAKSSKVGSGVVLSVATAGSSTAANPVQTGFGSSSSPPPAPRAASGSTRSCQPSLTDSTSAGSPSTAKKDQQATVTFSSDYNVKERKIVIYIAAADSQDCKIEKGIVHSEVYPVLRRKCREHNFELHVVDLHWSLQDKSPQPDHLYLHELARQNDSCYLIPLVFLNNTLGTPLLPKTLESADFETVTSQDSEGVLVKWYALDAQAQPPCYRLLPASAHIKGLKCSETKEKGVDEWNSEVDTILNVMLSSFAQELRDTYLTTVVEEEVRNCVLMSRELAKRCIWFSRSGRGAAASEQSSDKGLMELKRRWENLQKALKNELEENHIIHVSQTQEDYSDIVRESLKKQLSNIIDSIIEDSTKSSQFDSVEGKLGREVAYHRKVAQKEAQTSVNRQQLIQNVFSYKGNGPIVFHGSGGCGKTTILSRLAHSMEKEVEGAKVFYRKVGLTRQSSTLSGLLQSLTRQLHPGKTRRIHRIEEYTRLLPICLQEASKEKEIAVIIDGIDQFRDFGEINLMWIPKTLPDNCKFIVSLSDESMMKELRTTLDAQSFIEIPNLEKSERDSILTSSIFEYNHSFNPEVNEILPDSCTLPLHIKVIAWQTTWSTEYDIQLIPKTNLRDQLEDMMGHLEKILGKEKVEKVFSLLLASKYGLQDSEMVDILTSDESYHTSTTYLPWAGAFLFWSKLTRILGNFLEWSDLKTTKFKDKELANVCKARYKSTIPSATETLKKYFSGKLWASENKARMIEQSERYGDAYNVRMFEELPYACCKSDGTALKYTMDHNWIIHKLSATDANQVIEDVKLEPPTDDTAWLCDFLEVNFESLTYEGRQFYTQLSRHFLDSAEGNSALASAWKAVLSETPVTSLVQSKTDDVDPTTYNLIRRLPNSRNFVVTICREKSEISVWDVAKCKRVRQLSGLNQPADLRMVDDRRCVVLCGRELHIYDLDKGVLITKLKGVMNQKMPYFGLHDSTHLVALSRNRMYVNLMNLDSGDLVTTFKAGEDRFLNSLLVSGDGKILVCGDETQKPSPMLVWNLASRKLLYDIRIPQHEFISRLSAITYQGNYVCFVTKEVVENSPNYLVVYDLQSGTLFKKWKPGVDTTSVEISPKEGCLVTGLADSRVLVWDLITGNCRYTLRGHSSAVDSLRLSPDGRLCLSWDTRGNDRSMRIWDLSSGGLVSAFTPESPPGSCELTDSRLVISTEDNSSLVCLRITGPEYVDTEQEEESIYDEER